MTQRSRRTLSLAAIVLSQICALGCGGSKKADAKTPGADSLPLALDHEPCDINATSADKIDTNGDGKPDIIRVVASGKESCRMVDLNHDGKPDSYLYFEGAEVLRRRESDFDRDGKLDEIAYYSGGKVTRKDRETNLDGKLDTWDFYEGGQIHHRMRDSDGDGKVDQWWTWPDPTKLDCAVIASDRNGDGKPDPAGVLDVCAAAAPPAAPAAPAAAATPSDAGAATSSTFGNDGGGVSMAARTTGLDAGSTSSATANKGVQ